MRSIKLIQHWCTFHKCNRIQKHKLSSSAENSLTRNSQSDPPTSSACFSFPTSYMLTFLPENLSLSTFLCSGTCRKVQSSLVQPTVLQKKHSFLYRLQEWHKYVHTTNNHAASPIMSKCRPGNNSNESYLRRGKGSEAAELNAPNRNLLGYRTESGEPSTTIP